MLRFFEVVAPRLDPAHAASEAVFSGMTLAEFAARFALHLTPRRALRAAMERARRSRWWASVGPWWVVAATARQRGADVVVAYDMRPGGEGTMLVGARPLKRC